MPGVVPAAVFLLVVCLQAIYLTFMISSLLGERDRFFCDSNVLIVRRGGLTVLPEFMLGHVKGIVM